jgi:4-amino-4-deoxy-L-arabinose transferase-like glycosyltransferase
MSAIEQQLLGEPAPDGVASRAPRTWWQFWRSPVDQPAFARPALLGIAALACLGYAWGAGDVELEPFYGAAARSMSQSLHNFFFGSFDPQGTITVDKLPGGLWPQAISLRIFGFHTWAVVLPQIVFGVLTVLVLYRAVRRLAGPLAGLVAVAVITVTPVSVALNRGNVADSLLVLLTVLAADAASAALTTGRLRSLVLAGVWIGLGFQAKMGQAWLIAPALALAYVIAAPASLRVRLTHLGLAGAVTVVVSLSWMTVVTLVPADQRPYIDGSTNNSVYIMVFDYNGIARLGGGTLFGTPPTPTPFLVQAEEESNSNQVAKVSPSWHRLLSGLVGRDYGWLLPAALIAAFAVLAERRGRDRRDPMRAGVVLWGTWLIVLFGLFSGGTRLNSYYTAALVPAVAALCGAGAATFLRHRQRMGARGLLALAVAACTGYGVYLLEGGADVPGWLVPAALVIAVGGGLAALLLPRIRGDAGSSALALAGVLACMLPLSAVTGALMITRDFNPFTAPYQPGAKAEAAAFDVDSALLEAQQEVKRLADRYRTPIPFAIDSSQLAGPYVFASGEEVLPIGGFKGGVPEPTVGQLEADVTSGRLRAILVPTVPVSEDPRVVWVRDHCALTNHSALSGGIELGFYDCGDPARA